MVADEQARGRRAKAVGAARRRVPGWGWLLLALVLGLVLRAPFLGLPLISDEGGYALVTERWLAGEGRLYHDLWVSRPQGIFLAYAAILETLGRDAVALRLGAWVWAAATTVLVWRFAGAWRGPRVAALAALVFAALAASPAVEGFTANAEVFMALPAAAAAWLLVRAGRGGWGARPLLAAGGCAGAATLLKPSGVVMLGVGLAAVWLVAGETRSALRRGAWLLAGFGAALLPAAVHGWWVGWNEFVYAAVTYRLTSQSGATAGLRHQAVSIVALLGRCWPLLALTAAVLLAGRGGWPLPASLRAGFGRDLARASRLGLVAARPAPGRWRGDVAPLVLRLWLLASLAGVAVGGDWWAHYLIQPAAPFAIWLAGLLARAWPRLDVAARRALAILAVVALLSPYAAVARGSVDAISTAVFGQRHYPDQDEVADYLRRHTPADASIFVAFDHPAIYHLAERRAAYRHLYDAELQAIPGSYGDLLALIQGPDRPRYIAVTSERAPYPDRGEAFWEAVLPRYHLVDTVQGVPILRADDGLGRNR